MVKGNYIIIDQASTQDISYELEKVFTKGEVLLQGKYKKMFFDVAPLFCALNAETINYAEHHLWGMSAALFVMSSKDEFQLIKTLSANTEIVTDDDEVMFFRYYDPRVLRIFLPTCSKEQLKEFFGAVEYFICEDEDPGYGLVYAVDKNYSLSTYRITKDHCFQFIKSLDTSLLSAGMLTSDSNQQPTEKSELKQKKSGDKNKFSIFD
jgi:hypothetical protein